MEREFIYFKTFDKNWNELGLSENNLAELEKTIMANPEVGSLIQGTGGLRKLRFALPPKGKSGGVRVLYIDFISLEKTVFMNVYSKNRQENITNKEKQEYKVLIEMIAKELIE